MRDWWSVLECSTMLMDCPILLKSDISETWTCSSRLTDLLTPMRSWMKEVAQELQERGDSIGKKNPWHNSDPWRVERSKSSVNLTLCIETFLILQLGLTFSCLKGQWERYHVHGDKGDNTYLAWASPTEPQGKDQTGAGPGTCTNTPEDGRLAALTSPCSL